MNRVLFALAFAVLWLPVLPNLNLLHHSFAQDAVESNGSSVGPGQTSPLAYVKDELVVKEIGVTDSQLALVDRFQPICDAACEGKINQIVGSMPQDLQEAFATMSFEQRMSAMMVLEQDIQESTELDTLSNIVLEPDQMARFNQIWTQQSGLAGLVNGNTSRNLGISDTQKASISQIQNIGFTAMDACVANQNLSSSQRNIQIQQIQNTIVNLSINVLNVEQINLYVGLCGEPLDQGDGVEVTGEIETDVEAGQEIPDTQSPAVDVGEEQIANLNSTTRPTVRGDSSGFRNGGLPVTQSENQTSASTPSSDTPRQSQDSENRSEGKEQR